MPTPLTACVRLGRLHLATLYAAGAQLTPRIERHPDALVLDLRGGEQLVLRLKGSWGPPSAAAMWPALAARLHERLRGAVLEARGDAEAVEQLRIGLAPTRTAAWLAAATLTTASWRTLDPSQVAIFLHPLPIDALLTVPDLAGATHGAVHEADRHGGRHRGGHRALEIRDAFDALAHSGILTLGQLARLSASALERRFGALGLRLALLAAGQDIRPFRVWVPAPWIGARLCLKPPVEAAQLTHGAFAPLAQHLAANLAARHLGAGAVALAVHMEDGATWRATRRLGQPVTTSAAFIDLARRLLAARVAQEPQEPGGSVTAIHLRVGDLSAVAPRQDGLWLEQSERERRARRARLVASNGPLARCHGGAALLRATLAIPHEVFPEARYQFVPLLPHSTAA